MNATYDSQHVMDLKSDPLNPSTTPERHRFHFLDVLRGVAAIVVMMRHAPSAFGRVLNAHNSYLAVDFFFCLSGFVIAFSYEKRLRTFMSFWSFSVSRFIRLWPIAFLGGSIGALELALGHYIPGYENSYRTPGPILPQLILGLLTLPDVSLQHLNYLVFPLDLVIWTLFVEVIANLVYPALVKLGAATTWLLGLLTSFSFFLLAIERKIYGTINLGYRAETFHVGITRVFFSFFLGVLVHRIYKHVTPQLTKGRRSGVTAVILLGIFSACLCDPVAKTYIALCDLLIVCVLFPLIIYFGASLALASRWTAICAFLGTISYPLYVLHTPFFWILFRANFLNFARLHPSKTVVPMVCLTPIIVFIAWAADQYYDAPFRRLLTKRYLSQQKRVLV